MYSMFNTDYLEYTLIIFLLGAIAIFTGATCCFMLYLCVGFFQERERRSLLRLMEAITV